MPEFNQSIVHLTTACGCTKEFVWGNERPPEPFRVPTHRRVSLDPPKDDYMYKTTWDERVFRRSMKAPISMYHPKSGIWKFFYEEIYDG